MTTTLTHDQLRAGLLQWAKTSTPNVRQAVRLLAGYNVGRIMHDPEWVTAFAVPSRGGVWLDWDLLDAAMNGDDDAPEAARFAVMPFSTSERSVMRFACDLGMNRWMVGRWDATTTVAVVDAFTAGVGR